MLSNDVH